jgi:small subunit ribosomal protein S6
MPLYEMIFVARPNLTAAEVDSITQNFKDVLKKEGGEVVSTEYWGLRTLAYKIKKNSRGHYMLMNINSPFPAIAELERIMGFNEDLIRTAIFKLDSLPKNPSDLMVSVTAKDSVRTKK